MMTYEPQTREVLDDMLIAGRDMARFTRGQYEAFKEAGFSSAEALRLVQTWLAESIRSGS